MRSLFTLINQVLGLPNWRLRPWVAQSSPHETTQPSNPDHLFPQPTDPLYREIVETQTELICRYQPDGTIDYVNPAYCRYFGIAQADLIGKTYEPVVYPADLPMVRQQVQSMSCQNPQVVVENRVIVAGEVRWTQWHNRCFCDSAGRIIAYQSVGRDISQLKAIESELRASEKRYRSLNQTLEQRVEHRVAELAAVNRALTQEIHNHQQAKASLKASEERFRRAIVDAPFPIIIHGEDGRILQMSHVVSEITGYSEDDLKTLDDWAERAYGERQNSTLKQIHQLYSLEERVNEGEFEVKTLDGRVRTWLFSSAPLGQLADGTRLVISMAADVTEQKQAEHAVAIRLKQQAVMTQLSQYALSGLEPQDLFDKTTCLIAASLGVEFAKVLKLLPDGQTLQLQSGFGWQPGLVGRATVSTRYDSQAGYTLFSRGPVVVENLATELRFNGPPLLIQHGVASGISTIIQGVGDQPYGILGAHSTRPQQFTQNDVDFLQAIANLLATAIYQKHSEQQLQQLNQHLERRVQDRTQALEEVNQELEAFSYSVAHDLRAPLRAIQGFAQVLVEDYGEVLDDLGKDYIHRMATSAEHLDVLVQDLLTYSRLGREEIHLQPVNLNRLIHSLLDDFEAIITKSRARIEVAPNLPTVQAQRSVLRQVLTNLIDNALKFVAPGTYPQLHIWAQVSHPPSNGHGPAHPTVRLWVEDRGIGIAPNHQNRIFDAFERLHGVEAYAGTGIGLAIVRRGVQRIGGEVGVEADLDQGSRFWIDLPLATEIRG
jgi:PAS domain S-box-containing protein